MKKILKVMICSALVIGLSACQNKPTPPPSAVNTGGAPVSAGAKTYGIGEKPGLTGADVEGGRAGGFRTNSLTAPSNQVYYFSYDQSAINAADLRAVNVQANYLATHKNAKVRLEGNTDDRGSREYNVALGWRRAQAVARVLEQRGVARSQIKIVSYGKEHPAVVGNNEQAWSLNRRVELIYVQK